MTGGVLSQWPLRTSDLAFIGTDLRHPECVAALATGEIFASDARGGMACIAQDGAVTLIAAKGVPAGFRPNGFSILPGRRFVVANIGEEGGVWLLSAAGDATPFCLEVGGRALPGTNFAGHDDKDRTWISISSWRTPRKVATSKAAAPDGSLILVMNGEARIVADGLAYTNEARVHPSGDWLYVCETTGRRLSRFRILASGDLAARETVTEFTDCSFPDGLAFDAEGWCWVACIGSQRVIRVDVTNGAQQIVLDESTTERDEVERKFNAGEMRAWDDSSGVVLGRVSGLCFGGPDLHTVYLGSLTRSTIASFRSPIAGAKPSCWGY